MSNSTVIETGIMSIFGRIIGKADIENGHHFKNGEKKSQIIYICHENGTNYICVNHNGQWVCIGTVLNQNRMVEIILASPIIARYSAIPVTIGE